MVSRVTRWTIIQIVCFCLQTNAHTTGTYMQSTRYVDFVGCSIDMEKRDSSELGCALSCESEDSCVAATYNTVSRICKITGDDLTKPCIAFQAPGSILMEKLGSYEELTFGLQPHNPASSCKVLRNFRRETGTYWLDLDGGSHDNALQAFCDMNMDGGGWTLVWSYTFTDYSRFNSGTNAITPRPNWTTRRTANVPVSTQAPHSDKQLGAMDFQQWKTIGEEFLMKSNINNWVACVPNIGNLVQWKSGNVTCRMVKQLAAECNAIVPYRLITQAPFGPVLSGDSYYYYYDGNTTENWPTHDPCGTGQPKQLKGVVDPRGSIYIR